MGQVTYIVKNIYNDPFKWSIVKSVTFFAMGVKLALLCKGLDLMAPQPM